MTNQSEPSALDVLDELAFAIARDSSILQDIDGRTVKHNLLGISLELRWSGLDSMRESRLRALRFDLNLCPEGQGHWSFHCNDCERPPF